MYRIVKAATGDGLGHAPVRSRVGVGYRLLASVKESKNSELSKPTMVKRMRIISIEGEILHNKLYINSKNAKGK